MTNRPDYRKLVLLTLMLVLVLGMATESRAEDGGCLDWLWPWNWFSSRTTYAPPYPGPAMVPPSTYCGPCAPAPACCPAPSPCVPQTSYRTVVDRVPVTTYMPVVTTNPCTGCATTAYRPTFMLTRQVRLIPYTTAYMGYSGGPCSTCVGVGSCVGGSCGMAGYSGMGGYSGCSSCGPSPCGGSPCGGGDGCSPCGVGGGCSPCGVDGSSAGCSSCGVPVDAGAPGAITPVPGGASTAPVLPGPVAPDQSYPANGATPVVPPSSSTTPPPTFAPPATPANPPATPANPPAGSGTTPPPATYRNQSLPGPTTQVKPIPDLGPGYRPLPLPRPAVNPADSRTTWTPAPVGPAIRLVAATPRTAAIESAVSSPVLSSGATHPATLTEWHAARD